MNTKTRELVAQFAKDRDNLIPILQKVQAVERFLSPESIREVGGFLGISENDIYSVASFYPQFRFSRLGELTVTVCLCTACHVRGGERILESVVHALNIQPGQTTDDFMFTLETGACFGCSPLAPVMMIDQEVYGRLTPTKAKEVLARYK